MSIPASIWSGEMRFGPLTMKCHVLDDGSRIIEQESVLEFMAWIQSGDVQPDEVQRVGRECAEWTRRGFS